VERIAMSTKEATRGAVLARVAAGKVTLIEAAAHLDVGYRQVRRLFHRYTTHGRRGMRHGNVGRRSNRARPAVEQQEVLQLIRTHYSGPATGPGQRFGPTLAAEHLWTEHGVLIPVPTLRRWMVAADLWSRQRRARPVHVRRPRRAAFGELLQLDGSFHDWFEGRGPRPCLMSLIDDATGTMLARFGAQETTWAAADLLRAWITQHGIPGALYTDAKTVYVRLPTTEELLTGRVPRTQLGQMCARLGIQVIIARSPEAKGRIERNHGTSQDRLVKKLRVRGIATNEAANAFLAEEYLADHNRRFAVRPESGVDGHTPLRPTLDLDEVFCLEEPRRLGKDWMVRYHNRGLQVTPTRAAQRHVGPGGQVLVREDRAGRLRVVVCSRTSGREYVLAWTPIDSSLRRAEIVPAAAAPRIAAVAPAGFTRSGKPLSATQMAVRTRWSNQVTTTRGTATTGPQPPAHP
jgi:transposase